MKNKLILFSIIALAIFLGGVGYFVSVLKNVDDQSLSIPTSNISYSAKESLTSKQSGLHLSTYNLAIPFSVDYRKGEVDLQFQRTPEYTDPITKDIISFKIRAIPQAVNPSYDIYVDNQKVGQGGGIGIAMASFSPDGKYFTFRSRNDLGCAGMCEYFGLYVVDIMKLKSIFIESPSSEENAAIKANYTELFSFIDSYSWISDDHLNITSYTIGFNDNDGRVYRVSPIEIRRYDPTDGSYVLVQTIPETK
jgi:hypothetical protein